MAEGKWISDLTPGTSLVDAARRVLSIRLEVVRDFLGLALKESDKDLEYVHQLRVGTRRAGAALDIFAVCLPDKVYRKARKHLRRFRRAAGAARDWDVFLSGLPAPEKPRAREQPGLDFLTGYALAQRLTAQEHLEEEGEDYPFGFERLLAEVLAELQKPAGQLRTLGDLARPLFGGLLEELRRAAAGNLEDYDHLHQVRIVGKRLRYAMEVFADCFEPFFREELYPAVEQMQEFLGRANDSHVAGQRLTALGERLQTLRPRDWKRSRTCLEGLLAFHAGRLPEERQHFLEWWGRWHDSFEEPTFFSLLKPAPTRAVRSRPGPAPSPP